MDTGHGKMMRVNHVQGDDRLSSLPDDLIHKILSSFDIRNAIGTSVLSSRWRFLWTTMPSLIFSIEDFPTLPKFSKFVTNVLSRRNNLTEVSSMKLTFRVTASQLFVKRVLNYAFSHNIQRLNVVCLLENDIEFPLSLFTSPSLKHLSLTTNINQRSRKNIHVDGYFLTPTSSWELSRLTTLDLHSVTLYDDESDKCIGIFSKCDNLKNLTLKQFRTFGSNGLRICHPGLSNLTLESSSNMKVVNVVAPQLKNLTIRFCYAEFVISACDLASLLYKGRLPLRLSTDCLHSLEKADICVSSSLPTLAHQIVSLLQQLHNVKFLSLNLETVELFSSSVELVLPQPSPFVNLKSLKIYPATVCWREQVAMSTELRSYLLDGSPGATFTMVLREEILAHKFMAELEVLLEEEKDNTKTNRAYVDRGKTPRKQKVEMKLKPGENIEQIKSCWKIHGLEIELRKKKVDLIILNLQYIEKALTKLPASKRAKIQPRFSSLCTEAEIAISKITDCLKIRCDENQSQLKFWFQELATTLESS